MSTLQITVLVDNNTLIDRYFLGEPALSFLIQANDKQILFDTGYSNIFIKNAQKMDVNLLNTNFIVISHGHLDHTWGLEPLIRLYSEAMHHITKPFLVAHPTAFETKFINGCNEIGSLLSEKKLKQHFDMKLTKNALWITENLVFLGEIERTNDFENKEAIGKVQKANGQEDDFLLDDSALAYKSPKGLIIITGCSHAGICNIIEQAKKICNENRVIDVIGGFHLLHPSEIQLNKTLKYIKDLKVDVLHPCHCVDLYSKLALSRIAKLEEVGVGLKLQY